jgi:predicted nucleic acid-binding protein
VYRLVRMPTAPRAADSLVLDMINAHRLQGSGIGYVDAHLLAACLLVDNMLLWTLDRRLAAVAKRLSVDAPAA